VGQASVVMSRVTSTFVNENSRTIMVTAVGCHERIQLRWQGGRQGGCSVILSQVEAAMLVLSVSGLSCGTFEDTIISARVDNQGTGVVISMTRPSVGHGCPLREGDSPPKMEEMVWSVTTREAAKIVYVVGTLLYQTT
jgi:hypothetical protein